VRESYRFCSRIALIGSAVMAVFVALFADAFVVLFAGADEQMRTIGAFCMISQCIALPIHGWVAIVNMLCAGLGNAKGAFTLATARQGSCFIPILYPMAWILGAYGIATVQAVADVLTILLAIPIIRAMKKKITQAQAEQEALPV
jgi:Na+-driven multidrug efflux pump